MALIVLIREPLACRTRRLVRVGSSWLSAERTKSCEKCSQVSREGQGDSDDSADLGVPLITGRGGSTRDAAVGGIASRVVLAQQAGAAPPTHARSSL